MLKVLLSIFGLSRQEPVVDGNQERPLPPRWRDPAVKPARQPASGQRAD